MKQQFKLSEITGALGVAPSTANLIAGLLNGTLRPDRFTSIDVDPLITFDLPLEYGKIMQCLATLLEGQVARLGADPTYPYVDRGDEGIPTVILFDRQFLLLTPAEFLEEYQIKTCRYSS